MYVLVMMTKEGSTKIIIFMTFGAGILVLGCGDMSYSENASFLLKIFFSTPRHMSNKLSMKQ